MFLYSMFRVGSIKTIHSSDKPNGVLHNLINMNYIKANETVKKKKKRVLGFCTHPVSLNMCLVYKQPVPEP